MNKQKLIAFCEKNAGGPARCTSLVTGARNPSVQFKVTQRVGADGYRLWHIHHGSNTANAILDPWGDVEQWDVSLCGYDTVTTWKHLRTFLSSVVGDYAIGKRTVSVPRGMKVWGTGSGPYGRPEGDGAVTSNALFRRVKTMYVGMEGFCREEILRTGTRWYVDVAQRSVYVDTVGTTTLVRSIPVPRGDREVREKLQALKRIADRRMWQSAFPDEWRQGIPDFDELEQMYSGVAAGEIPVEILAARLRGTVRWPQHIAAEASSIDLEYLRKMKNPKGE